MAKQLHLSVVIEMPACPFDASDVYAKIKAPWGDLLNSLQASGVTFDPKVDELEVRAKAVRKPRKPKPRDTTNGDGKPLGTGHDMPPQ